MPPESSSSGGFQPASSAIALEWADVNTSGDPEFLEPLATDATRFALTDGETRSLDLRLIR